MDNTAIHLVDPPTAEGVTGRRHLSVLLLAGVVQKRGRILDRDPRRSPCPPLCLKAGSCISELPLTAVRVICSLKPLMMEISVSLSGLFGHLTTLKTGKFFINHLCCKISGFKKISMTMLLTPKAQLPQHPLHNSGQ